MENRVKITVNVDYSKKSFFSFVKLLVPSMRNGLIFWTLHLEIFLHGKSNKKKIVLKNVDIQVDIN